MSNDPVWQEALQVIAQEVNERAFRMWFQPAVGLGLSDGAYCVGVGSEFARDWIEGRFLSLIQEAVAEVLGEEVPVKIVVVPTLSHNSTHAAATFNPPPSPAYPLGHTDTGLGSDSLPLNGHGAFGTDPLAAPASPFSPEASHLASHRGIPHPAAGPAGVGHTGVPGQSATGLIRKYTFDNFVVGPSNRFAHAAALAAAESPGTQYNPLFIYGGVGLGKTHLLQAIGNYVVDNHPGLKVRYLTLETFTNDFINSLRDDTIEGFKARYRTVDVLLLDDIQFLHKKEQTQEEFFHTFNALYDAQKQIVITSDRHPKALDTVEDRLVSRFEWGLITDIQPPDLETRVAILRKKVRAEQIAIAEDDVLMLIASRVPSNIRELEGCLTRVVAYSSFTRRPITVDLAREVLKDIPETTPTTITVDMILHAVAHETGVSVADIVGDKRARQVVQSRHLAMYLARELTDASLPKIGEHFGGRDHTTVLHAVEKISKLMHHDRALYNRIQHLLARLKSA